MFGKNKITLAKAVIYDHLEEFLDKIINLEYVIIEVGLGIDKPHPNLKYTDELLARLFQLRRILLQKKIPLSNIRIHLPIGYHFEVYDHFWHPVKKELYDSFSIVDKLIKEADRLGFRQFDMHPPMICVHTKNMGKEYVREYNEALKEYCHKLKKLRKSIKGTIFMEFVGHDPEQVYDEKGVYKKYIGVSFDMFRYIISKTGIQPLLDTSVFDSIGEYKIAKKRLEHDGFQVKAIHIQRNRLRGHHNPLSEEDFRKIIDDFAGIIVDEGLYDYEFKEGELNERIGKGEDLSHLMLTPDQSIEWVRRYWEILKKKEKANLLFRLKNAIDGDVK